MVKRFLFFILLAQGGGKGGNEEGRREGWRKERILGGQEVREEGKKEGIKERSLEEGKGRKSRCKDRKEESN